MPVMARHPKPDRRQCKFDDQIVLEQLQVLTGGAAVMSSVSA